MNLENYLDDRNVFYKIRFEGLTYDGLDATIWKNYSSS